MLRALVNKALENESADISIADKAKVLVNQSRDLDEIFATLGTIEHASMMIKEHEPKKKAAFFWFKLTPEKEAAAALYDHSKGEYTEGLLKAVEPIIEETVF